MAFTRNGDVDKVGNGSPFDDVGVSFSIRSPQKLPSSSGSRAYAKP